MAVVPRRVLEYVSGQVNALSDDAQSRVLSVLESIEWTPENVAECRELLVQALTTVMPAYTDAAAQAGADLYDAVRESSVGERMGATALSGYEPDATEGAVRAFVQDIVDGKPVEQFNRKVLERVDYDIRRAENVSVADNVALDPLKPKYARVPSGSETCNFCLMLASRGFAYTSRDAASHAHPECDCRVVQGYDGMEVEGYDPDALYSDYLDGKFGTFANKKRGGGSRTVSHAEAYKRMGEFNDRMRPAKNLDELYAVGDEASAWFKSLRFSGDKRSREQARDTVLSRLRAVASRRHGELSVGGKPGIVTYAKPRSELLEHERAGVDWLASRGFDVETIPEVGDAPANLDIVMDGEEWEMKNVTNAGRSVTNQLSRVREKFWKLGRPGEGRGVITTMGCSDPFEDVVAAVESKDGYRAIVVISESDYRLIEK